MIVDFEYYRDIFGGGLEEDIISPFFASAERIVMGAVLPEVFSVGENTALKTAVCVQAEYTERLRGGTAGYPSVRLGDFSMGGYDGISFEKALSSELCDEAAAVLDRAGLFYRGIGTEVTS